MLYRHVFVKIFTEFRGIFHIFVNFAAPRPREISEALFNQCRNKEFCVFLGKLIYNSNRKLFSCMLLA